jgi:hypothetical protein
MSDYEKRAENTWPAIQRGKARVAQGPNLRFTPLRSYLTRSRTLPTGAGQLAKSRIVPVPRLQS